MSLRRRDQTAPLPYATVVGSRTSHTLVPCAKDRYPAKRSILEPMDADQSPQEI